jgi:hypothetical protein
MPLAYTIYYTLIFGSIFLMFQQWYLNIVGTPLTQPESMTLCIEKNHRAANVILLHS